VRTTLDLDDEMMEALLARLPGMSKTEAIETAVQTFLADDAAARLRRLAGTVEIRDLSQVLRSRDRRS
jgi:hypothetical protein